jgi:hypothetical protein
MVSTALFTKFSVALLFNTIIQKMIFNIIIINIGWWGITGGDPQILLPSLGGEYLGVIPSYPPPPNNK